MPGNASLSPKLRTALRKPCDNTQRHVDNAAQLLVTTIIHTRELSGYKGHMRRTSLSSDTTGNSNLHRCRRTRTSRRQARLCIRALLQMLQKSQRFSQNQLHSDCLGHLKSSASSDSSVTPASSANSFCASCISSSSGMGNSCSSHEPVR